MGKLNEQKVKKYLGLLPKEVKVRMIFSPEEGFSAEVLNFPGCITEGTSIAELISMVNHAIATYLEIPKDYACLVGYLPSSKGIEDLLKKTRRLKEKPAEILFPFPLVGLDVYQSC